jgi:hypothetical protein
VRSKADQSAWPLALAELEEMINAARAAHARWEGERSDVNRTIAAADASRARDLDCLYAAHSLLRCAASGRRPPRRLSARLTQIPGPGAYSWQLRRLRHLVPRDHVEQQLVETGAVSREEAFEVGRLTEQLQLGRRAQSRWWTLMEPAIPVDNGIIGQLRSQPMSARRGGLRHRWQLSRATAVQVPEWRSDEADHLWRDRNAVWERSRMYAAAVLDLLRSAQL